MRKIEKSDMNETRPQENQGNMPPRPQKLTNEKPADREGMSPPFAQRLPMVNNAPEGESYDFPAPSNSQLPDESDIAYVSRISSKILDAISKKVVGQQNLKQSLLIALLTNGHLLLESLPGLAKTTAAASLAQALDAQFKRIQCTPDLLPADIIGTQVYNSKTGEFTTQLGPVHTNISLLDEINRSSAKTQSAMLEAMQERQTSIGGQVYKLPHPFLVLATQNPIEQEGTYRLPEAQLDRFLLKETLTYPTTDEELEIIAKIESGELDENNVYKTDVTIDDVIRCQEIVKKVYLSEDIKKYIVHIVEATRSPYNVSQKYADVVEEGASPRATIAFLKASQAVAALHGRDAVLPDDVQEVAHRVLRHRISLKYTARSNNISVEEVIDAILDSIKLT